MARYSQGIEKNPWHFSMDNIVRSSGRAGHGLWAVSEKYVCNNNNFLYCFQDLAACGSSIDEFCGVTEVVEKGDNAGCL